MPAFPKNVDRDELRNRASHLRIIGLTLPEIGERLGISTSTAWQLCEEANEKEIELDSLPIKMWRRLQAREAEAVKTEAWKAWRGVGQVETSTETEEGDDSDEPGAKPSRRKRKKVVHAGNPAQLAIILKADERIAKLYGLEQQPGAMEDGKSDDDSTTVRATVTSREEADRVRGAEFIEYEEAGPEAGQVADTDSDSAL